MMRRIRALAFCVSLLPLLCPAQEPEQEPEQDPERAISASLLAYWLPDGDRFTAPTVAFDRGKLHLEARYNYENLNTTSGWVGYNSHFGDAISVEFTPMLGFVSGDTNGIAPGYHLTIGWRVFDFYTEGEYVFDRDDHSDSFFYSWSELAWSPRDWLRLGLAAQRTRVYRSERDLQPGFLVGVSLGAISLGAYVFNPDRDDPTYVASLAVVF
jgi:hypothetical protein